MSLGLDTKKLKAKYPQVYAAAVGDDTYRINQKTLKEQH